MSRCDLRITRSSSHMASSADFHRHFEPERWHFPHNAKKTEHRGARPQPNTLQFNDHNNCDVVTLLACAWSKMSKRLQQQAPQLTEKISDSHFRRRCRR